MKHDWLGLKKYFRKKRAVILMYHRVANLTSDPWQLAVSPENFEAQIAILKKYFKVISLRELFDQLQQERIDSDCVCVTFDDGYFDNFKVAGPILNKHSCPATFFIASHYLKKQQLYWWDELELIVLHTPKLPAALTISINDEVLNFSFNNDGWLSEEEKLQHKNWIWPDDPPTPRCAAYLTLWEKLRPLPYISIERVLKTLAEIATPEIAYNPAHLPMTFQQLKEFSSNKLFTIGLHTNTHPGLQFHSREYQLNEIRENKDQLEQLIEAPVNYLSYPYGLYNEDTLAVSEELKIKLGFTTKGKAVTAVSPRLKLGRYQVLNKDGDSFRKEVNAHFK